MIDMVNSDLAPLGGNILCKVLSDVEDDNRAEVVAIGPNVAAYWSGLGPGDLLVMGPTWRQEGQIVRRDGETLWLGSAFWADAVVRPKSMTEAAP